MSHADTDARRRTRRVVAGALGASLLAITGCASSSRTGGRDSPPVVQAEVDQYLEEAQAMRATGRDDEALALLARAIERNPTLAVAHVEMGEIYTERGEYKEAERAYGTAATIEPGNFDAQYGHGLVLHLLNRLSEAVRAYLRALAIRPDDFAANLNLATAYLQLDGPPQALPYAQRAVELNPSSGPAHANLGAVYSAMGRHADAIREYEAAAELMDLTPALLINLAESLGQERRFDEMVNTLNAVIRLEATAAAWERVGFAYFKMRRYDDSLDAFTEAVRLDETHYPALNGMGVVLLNQYILEGKIDDAQRERAVRYLKASLRLNPRQPRIVELVSRFGR